VPQTAIEIERLSKRYRIGGGVFRYGRLTESLWRGLTRPLQRAADGGGATEYVWALDDISLDIEEGAALGIIGLNGAGKSTLLKVISRITPPTRGEVRLHGRVGSLLEVGTGFHPELSGRDNIFLNGAVLGMRKHEITAKFDEIVFFAGVERFIDTPVKRYSSGMYVRLAFAVAAHLETEILVVDEVLAVGDINFQRKCLGKMREVARGGRTVLFVSHQLAAISRLCTSAIWLERGKVRAQGNPSDVVSDYLRPERGGGAVRRWEGDARPGSGPIRLEHVALTVDGGPSTTVDIQRPFVVELGYEVVEPAEGLRVGFVLYAGDGTTVFMTMDTAATEGEGLVRSAGRYTSRCVVPGHFLNEGTYSIAARADQPNVAERLYEPGAVDFEVVKTGGVAGRDLVRWPGVTLPALEWRTEAAPADEA
jgi:lipopolysaccharide transport system ATP-binding protein